MTVPSTDGSLMPADRVKYIKFKYAPAGTIYGDALMTSEKAVSRREWVKYTGAAIGGLVVGGAIGYLAPRPEVKPGVTTETITSTKTETVAKTETVQVKPEFGKGLRFTYITHGGEENVFWNSVALGMKEAAGVLGVDAVMIRPKTEGDLAMESANFESTIAEKPDGIVVPICYEELLPLVKKATDAGIPTLVANIDSSDPEKRVAAGGLCFIGQNLEPAGYFLAQSLSKYFPSGSHALILMEGPGMVWAEQRAHGIVRFLGEYNCTYDRLDVSFDTAVVESRSSAYLEAHPETKAIFSVGYMATVCGNILKNMGKAPGEVAITGFDLVPLVIDGIKSGYTTLSIDQQPYLQGFLPIAQLTLMKKYGLSAWDVNTGNAIVDKSNVALVEDLSKKGYR